MNTVHDSSGLHRLDLNLFRVFEAVHRERNLTRAAEALSLSQSAVSHALSRLREGLGDPLFVRQGRGVAPTARAAQLAPAIQQALAGLRHAVQRGAAFDPRRDLTRLNLAIHYELEPILLPAVFARLRSAAPQLTIIGVRLDRAKLKADLAAGRIDLAVDVAQHADPELRYATLLEDGFCVVATPGRRRIGLKDYLAAQHIAVSSRPTGPSLEDFLLGRQGLQRKIALRCQHYETACRIAAASDLLLTMPRRQAGLMSGTTGVRLLPAPVSLPPLEARLYWHRQAEAEPKSLWLRGVLLELAAGYRAMVRRR